MQAADKKDNELFSPLHNIIAFSPEQIKEKWLEITDIWDRNEGREMRKERGKEVGREDSYLGAREGGEEMN